MCKNILEACVKACVVTCFDSCPTNDLKETETAHTTNHPAHTCNYAHVRAHEAYTGAAMMKARPFDIGLSPCSDICLLITQISRSFVNLLPTPRRCHGTAWTCTGLHASLHTCPCTNYTAITGAAVVRQEGECHQPVRHCLCPPRPQCALADAQSSETAARLQKHPGPPSPLCADTCS